MSIFFKGLARLPTYRVCDGQALMINISHSKVADLNEAIAKPDALWFDGVTVPKAEGAVVEATVILDIPNIAIFIEDHRGPATNGLGFRAYRA